jgi:hypothetical protein
MPASETITVFGNDGRIGTIDSTAQPLDGSQTHILMHLENGQPLWAPFDLLQHRADGSYYLPVDAPSPAAAQDRGSCLDPSYPSSRRAGRFTADGGGRAYLLTNGGFGRCRAEELAWSASRSQALTARFIVL